jgi:hypothetical protein
MITHGRMWLVPICILMLDIPTFNSVASRIIICANVYRCGCFPSWRITPGQFIGRASEECQAVEQFSDSLSLDQAV